jgi:intracellular multiplication protein IcmJ
MDFYPITLGTGRVLPTKDKARPASKEQRAGVATDSLLPASDQGKRILERDNHTCQCCGFRSEKYQEVHHKDLDRRNTADDNLITTCIFCHQCFRLNDVADMKSGALIWLPEIPQVMLNNIARAIYVARISQGPMAEAARGTLDILMARRADAEKRISTDDPSILSIVLNDYLPPALYAARAKKLEGLRLFPLDRRIVKEGEMEFNRFPQILAYWRSKDGPLGAYPPSEWIALYQDILAQAA